MELAVNVLPANATDATVSYASEDPKIAAVDSKGGVTGVSAGETLITIRAGGVTKRIAVAVAVATEYIDIDSDYVVLQPGETHRIKAAAVPAGASQEITYKSSDSGVVKVGRTGVLKARKKGSASVLVSNGEAIAGVTVIVSKESALPSSAASGGKDGEEDAGTDADAPRDGEKALISAIEEGGGTIAVAASAHSVLTKGVLAVLYRKGATLLVDGQGYRIMIKGDEVVNTENELDVHVSFTSESEGRGFVLNRGRNLPGPVYVSLTEEGDAWGYVYLFNEARKRYELLDPATEDGMKLDVGGRYLLASEKMNAFRINTRIIALAACAVIVLIAVLVIAKRRYWFW
jgi:hypothetical protein